MRQSELDELQNAAAAYVNEAMLADRVVNIPVLAEKLRLQYEQLNIALEDLEGLVLRAAQIRTLPIEFDGRRQIRLEGVSLTPLSSPIVQAGE